MRKKSIYVKLRWIGILLIGMGLIFFFVAGLMQFVTVNPQTSGMNPSRLSEEALFRLIFLVSFGLPALILMGVGVGLLISDFQKNKKERVLRAQGRQVIANHLNVIASNVRVNRQYQLYLTCSYTDARGNHYLFKSRLLRYDPLPFLDNQVRVYYDPNKRSRYFVDVDGSMQNVYE